MEVFFKFIMATASESREGEVFNMFLALEILCNQEHRDFISEIEDLQVRTTHMFPEQEPKPARVQSLHVTLATLMVNKEEEAFVIEAVGNAVDHFKRIHSDVDGIRADFQGGFTNRDVVCLHMGLGANTFNIFKQTLMVHGLRNFVTDMTQNPHLTVVRNLDMTDAEEIAVTNMMKGVTTARITLDTVSLRERKKAGEQLKPPVKLFGLWRE